MQVVKTARQEKAAATRRRAVDAAYELFCGSGYQATTMAAIAERAGVAVQTLYFIFHTKDALLQEVHKHAVLGGEHTPLTQRSWFVEAVAEPDAERAIFLVVEASAVILGRVAPMLPVFHAVAADAAGAIFRDGEERRRRDLRALAERVLSKAGTREDVSVDHAADVLFVLLGPETYRSFVLELGWTSQDWVRWTTETLVRDLCRPGNR